MAALPHRYPMLLVDRVESLEPDRSITAIKAVTHQRGLLPGPFPRPPDHARRADRRGAGPGRRRARGRNRSASRTRASWSISWPSKARSSAAPVEPGCLLQLEVEFVQKRATVCKFAGRAIGRWQARRRSQFHGDDRGSAGGLIAPVAVRALDPENLFECVLRRPSAGRALRPSRSIRSAISNAPLESIESRQGRAAQQDRLARRSRSGPHSSISRSPNRDRGWQSARRAAAASGRGASARAISTRARSPVDSWSIRPVEQFVQFSRAVVERPRLAAEPKRDHDRGRGSARSRRAMAGRKESMRPRDGPSGAVEILPSMADTPEAPAQFRPARGAGWFCRSPFGPTRQTNSPAATSATRSNRRPGMRQAGSVRGVMRVTLRRMCATSHRKKGRSEQSGDHADRHCPTERGQRGPTRSATAQQQRADQRRRPGSPGPGWPRVSRRAKIGATSPTKPIAPQTATQAPTAMADRRSPPGAAARGRSRATAATSSPSASRSSAGPSRSRSSDARTAGTSGERRPGRGCGR